jgi:CDP-glycerol glycerophosphotransferase (TagB/SpsB family)
VTGQAPKDRYLAADEGVRPEQVRIVGRPQLARLARAEPRRAAGDPPTVLYAPTWEGYFEQADYSSVAAMGVGIVRGLLDSGARVLVKPHPATGQRGEEAAAARAELEALVTAAPGGELLTDPGQDALYDAFIAADVLVTDVSSVLIDFLATHKPYLVTNPRGLDHDRFRAAYPSSAGGVVLDPDAVARIGGLVVDADAPELRARRAELAAYLLADDGRDPAVRFVDEVDAIVERAGAERAEPALGDDPSMATEVTR